MTGRQSILRHAPAYEVGQEREGALEQRILELEQQKELLVAKVIQLHGVKTMVELLEGIAHDMSSALTGIVWASDAIRRRLGAREPDLDAGIADFVSAALYTHKLARRLISIRRHADTTCAPCCLRTVVEQSLELLDAIQPASVSRVVELGGAEAPFVGSAEQLQQVVINLVKNAFDAMRESGGTLHVQLAGKVSVEHGRASWQLTVRDTGPGMSPEMCERAFEPFFTTKSGQGGNGLGLAVVRTIVEGHGGSVRLESRLGEGTRVEVLLPVLQDS